MTALKTPTIEPLRDSAGNTITFYVKVGCYTIGCIGQKLKTRKTGSSLETFPWQAILWANGEATDIGQFTSIDKAAEILMEMTLRH